MFYQHQTGTTSTNTRLVLPVPVFYQLQLPSPPNESTSPAASGGHRFNAFVITSQLDHLVYSLSWCWYFKCSNVLPVPGTRLVLPGTASQLDHLLGHSLSCSKSAVCVGSEQNKTTVKMTSFQNVNYNLRGQFRT